MLCASLSCSADGGRPVKRLRTAIQDIYTLTVPEGVGIPAVQLLFGQLLYGVDFGTAWNGYGQSVWEVSHVCQAPAVTVGAWSLGT